MAVKNKYLPIIPIIWRPLPDSKVVIDDVNEELTNAVNLAKEYFNSQIVVLPINKDSKKSLCNVGLLGRFKKINSEKNIVEIDLIKRIVITDEDVNYTKVEGLEFLEFAPVGDVKIATVKNFKEKQVSEEIEDKLVNQIFDLLDNAHHLNIDPKKVKILDEVELSSTQIADILATILNLNESDYIEYISEHDIQKKLEFIIKIFTIRNEESKLESKIEKELQIRLEKSQRDYFLREKIVTIKNMLGDTNDIDAFVTKTRKQIENNDKYPKYAQERILEELNKLSSIPSSSSDSNVLRNWIEWAVSLPWNTLTQEQYSLSSVQKMLDSHHSGLDKIKERILEFLAVRKIKNNVKGDILCFVGPPGVGKSTLARSIAESINREFVRISLGGVKDESEIRGHRRTYVGAQPGRIIQSLKSAKTSNPVFLLDEIEKMGFDYKGDPSGALLEVLDPEQNSTFSDHFLEIPYDLSNVLFIATANDLSLIPIPLRDRMEIIELSSYTVLEKIAIAQNNLLPKQLEKHGLKKSNFSITKKQLEFIIESYTFEAGVRNLERLIATLIRKSVFKLQKEPELKKVTINSELIIEFLGQSKIEPTKKPTTNEIGVVNGMAYTAYGGDLIPIEAVTTKGKGRIQITGNLQDVMKESAQIAFSHIKAFASKYELDFDEIVNRDLYLHALSGAVPKDGPSAGITMALAMYSALSNKKVNKNVSMTGEIGLRGQVLPIGGLKEKSMGALAAGIKDVIIPFDNQKDLDEIPQEIKSKLKFHPVKNFSEVIDLAII